MEVKKITKSKIGKVDFSGLGFGDVFTDHMMKMTYGKGKWNPPKIVPYGPVRVMPALSTLHYGQAVFDGD